MATTTTNLGLTKPAYSDSADVSVLNSNMDLIDAEAGRVRGNIAANYSASSAYAVGDLCLYTGVLYRCKTAIGSGGEAWNSGHWDAVKIAGQLSALSDQIEHLIPQKLIDEESTSTTKTLNIGNNARATIDYITNASGSSFSIIVTTNTSGAVSLLEKAKGSAVTFDASTNNKLVIGVGATARSGVFMIQARSKGILDAITLAT